jgi:D-threo-aldose 1-dehydrogenase
VDPTEEAQLGRSSVRIGRLGLGMAALGNIARTSDSDATAVIARTRALGLRHVDTAAEYGLGLAERRLGAALADLGGDGIVISTKVGRLVRPASRGYRLRHTILESVSSPTGARMLVQKTLRVGQQLMHKLSPSGSSAGAALPGPSAPTGAPGPGDLSAIPAAICDFSYDGVMRSFEESLVRLGVDRLDIAFIHEPDLHQRQAARSAYPALERLKAAGSVDAIGVAINDPEALVRFADRGDYDCFMIGGRYTLLEQPALDRLLPLALERGISIILGGPFNSGILANPLPGALYDYAPADRSRLDKARRIGAVCERHGVSIKAAALQFPLSHPAVVSVVVGAASVAEIEEDAALMGQPIPAELWDELRHEGLIDARVPTVARQ